jgi:Protein of unknown function (DUF1524)
MVGMTNLRSSAPKTLILTAVLLASSLAGAGAASAAEAPDSSVSRTATAESLFGWTWPWSKPDMTTQPVGKPVPYVPAKPAAVTPAQAKLATIPIKGRAPKTGYTRAQFGSAWIDTDKNGCDQRNDILKRDLTAETFQAGTKNCVVLTGTLADKYTGKTIKFVRGVKTSTAVQIDHIIPLSDAWQKGAQKLTAEQRKQLANDPLNLMAADGPTNGAKGDSDAASWLPPNKAFRCEYVTRQTEVKAKYKLWMTQPEHDTIAGILAGCK